MGGSRARVASLSLLGVMSLVAVGALALGVRRWYGHGVPSATTAPAAAPEAAPVGRQIKVRLFYVAEDGTRLSSVEHDVPYAAEPLDQAREILKAQLAPAAPPLVSAIPAGTVLRAVFITPEGDAFVDLSHDLATGHEGGSLNELLTIYTIVQALTVNLPAISAVQLLVDGKEVDTLSGHIDLRRPLARNVQLTGEN